MDVVRLTSHIVRGGRMAKTTKGAASIAPLVVAGGIIFGGGGAQAANECGPNTVGPTTIICSSGNYAGGSVYPVYPSGISYGGDGLTLVLDNQDAVLMSNGISINSALNNTGDISVTGDQFKSITTSVNLGRGIWASNFGPAGNTFARMGPSAGMFVSSGTTSYGVLAENGNPNNNGQAVAVMRDGSIQTSGSQGVGVYAFARGTGQTIASMSGGSITTTGEFGAGVYSYILNSNSTAIAAATLNSGTIRTSGRDADGLYSRTTGLGQVSSVMSGGIIETTGEFSQGIRANIQNGNNESSSIVSMSGGEILTMGASSEGIRSNTNGRGSAVIYLDGTATVGTMGSNAHALFAQSTLGHFDVRVLGSSRVSAASNTSSAVKTVSHLGGTVLVGDDAVIDGSGGFAFWDGDLNQNGADENAGSVVVTTSGTVTGDAIFGLGNDIFNLTGGIYAGDIYGDDRATVGMSLGDMIAFYDGLYTEEQLRGVNPVDPVGQDDTFNWSGGVFGSSFFGGNGSDTASITTSTYDGTYHVLDGSDDYLGSDGWIDELTLGGDVSGDVNGANLLHWERIYFDSVEISIADGALRVGTADDGLFLVNGAILDQSGIDLMLTGNLTNNGTLTTQDGVVGDVVTVAGNYTGTGLLRLDVTTTTDTADMLNIAGDVTGGATTIVVDNLSPLVATGNDITVVTVGGMSSAGDFALQGGSLTAGAFDYTLGQSGSNFVLAAAVNSTGAVYEAAPSVLWAFSRLPTLEQRVGERQWTGQSGLQAAGQPNTRAWVRFTGDKLDATTTTGSSIASKTWGLQTGADFAIEPGDAGHWVLGITGQYGKVSSTVTSALGFGTIDAEGFGVGATATWYGNTGTYVDFQGQVNWIDSDISSSAAGALATGQSAKAYALSAEFGHRFALNERSALVPQAQLMWGSIDGDAFTDTAGNSVDLGSSDRTVGRIGLAYEYAPDTATGGNQTKTYVIGNILHDFSGDSAVKVRGASLSTGTAENTWGEIGVGGSYAFDANKTLYGEAAYRTSFGGSSDNNGLSGTVGLRLQW